MKRKALLKRIRYYLQYFPITQNAFILGIALWLLFHWLRPAAAPQEDTTASFIPIILLIGKIALWFIAALIGFSILSAVVCWGLFLWQTGRHGYKLQLDFQPVRKGRGLWMETLLHKARRPFLGFIKGRLYYDDYKMTDKFLLASDKREKKQFWRTGIGGKNKMDLPDIREYKLEGGFVYFEDMLQLVSLPVKQTISGHFHQSPELQALADNPAQPRKTEETDVRIDQMRRVPGEYLNYKDFESGDDVRRVVWKVYAKNRELMVRVPEIFDPYASHIYYYASFHQAGMSAENDFSNEMLNYYKNRVWSIYHTLTRKEFDVRFIPDQPLQIAEHIEKDQLVQRIISNSGWQKQRDLSGYFEPRFGAVLCVSSFNTPEEIRTILDSSSSEVVVYYVKLSDTFRSFAPWAWLTRIFLLPPDDRLKRIRSRWLLTPMRRKLVKREKEIAAILANSDVHHITL